MRKMRLAEKLGRCVPPLKERVGNFKPLLDDSSREDEDKVDYLIQAIAVLNDRGSHVSRDRLIELAEELMTKPAWKVWQLMECVDLLAVDGACEIFISKYMDNMGKNVYWKPFIDGLLEYDEVSITSVLLFGDDFDKYLAVFDETVAMAPQAVHRYGLIHLPSLEMGRNMPVEIGSERSFYTTSDGTITIPPYQNTFDSREENLLDYKISFRHELGHHMWKTFEVRMHPDIFDYDAFGVRHVGHTRMADQVVVMVQKGEKTVEVRRFDDVVGLVDKPELLSYIHNVLDDGRVDANNIMYYPHLAAEYRRNVEQLLEKRPALDDPAATVKLLRGFPPELRTEEVKQVVLLIEAISQYAIAGEVRGTVPEPIRQKFQQCREIIDSMEMGYETDGTSSFNAAIRIYNLLKDDIDRLPQPDPIHNSSTNVQKGTRLVAGKRPKGKPGKPGVNPDKAPFQQTEAPENGEKGKQDDKPEKGKSYDGWDGEKFVRGEHVIVESKAEGPVIEADPFEVERVRTIFKKYAPKEGVLVRGLPEGEVDPELFQEYIDGLRCGKIGSRNYYCDVLYEERDVATALLVDLSGSTEPIREQILKAGSILGTASDTLHDPLIIAGFTTGGGDEESFIVMKDVQETDIRNDSRCGGTPMGGPIRHMCHRMNQPGIKHKGFKQMFVITDGQANVGKAPMEDAQKACDEAWKKHRIKAFGIGIITNEEERKGMEEHLDNIFSVGNYAVMTKEEVNSGVLHVFFEKHYRKLVGKLR